MKRTVLEKFLRYVAIDTQSDEGSNTSPSSAKQLDLARLLKKELEEMGLKNVTLDEYGYVMAELPANTKKEIPIIGFIAHMDTSPDMSGANIKPRIIEHYDGGDILLNKDLDLWIRTADFPEIRQYKGQTLVVTDGTTLLGADDKAGIAEIMSALEYLVQHPEIEHGTIKVAFTPDEEVGRGVDHFDVKKFGADFAYTIDGGAIGELEYENFNAAMATVSIQGRNIHPGYAKNRMKNAILIAMELNALLPVEQRPEFTTGYEGFYHIMKFDGSVEKATMKYIIRDHDRAKFEEKKRFITDAVAFINRKFGDGVVTLELKDQYFNMREKVEPVFHIVETAKKAMELCGVEPKVVPIRGGTDGSRLSYMGLPCPNIFAGGHNFHGKLEYVVVESMEKATMVILKIIELYTNGKN